MASQACERVSVHNFLLILFLSFHKVYQVYSNENIVDLPVLSNSNAFNDRDYIDILNEPSVLKSGTLITVDYACLEDGIVGLEVTAIIDESKTAKIFNKAWKCQKSSGRIKQKTVEIVYPDKIAYRPDIFHKEYTFVSNCKLQAWVLDLPTWSISKREHDGYPRAVTKVSRDVELPNVFSRPSYVYFRSCPPWKTTLLSELSVLEIPQCPYEKEIEEIIQYPAVMNGLPYGVLRSFTRFGDANLEKKRQDQLKKPLFSLSMWLYVLEYCQLDTFGLCCILCHVTWDSKYLTPVIFLNREGKIHIQVTLTDGTTQAGLTYFSAPKHEWFRLHVVFTENQWTLTLNHGTYFNQTTVSSFLVNGEVYLDDTEGLFSVGGVENTCGFRGYVGQATYYKNRAINADQVALPSPYHPMFELKLTRREEKCKGLIDWTINAQEKFLQLQGIQSYKDICLSYFTRFTTRWQSSQSTTNVCWDTENPVSKTYKAVDRIIERNARRGVKVSLKDIGESLYRYAVKKVDRNYRNIRKIVLILKQAACMGENDAMYMLAVILNNGVMIKADEIQAQAYLMMAALDRHRLSVLAMAHKHNYALDSIPWDKEQAYMYYKYVADTTRQDRELHKEADVMTESVRLTDEIHMEQQTDEDGDVFHWLKHQAEKGVFSAQQQVARALFWGSQGLKRNMQDAIEYFRMGAETEDSTAMYDYGILLVRGQGTKKNVTEGLTQIKKSAEKQNPKALNALGWYALNYDKNVTLAVQYFEEAYIHGNPDAAHNLGSLHLHGTYPGKEADADLALAFFNFAAVRNQIDSGVAVAYLNMKGTSKMHRQVFTAVEWARFIAEQNPALGMVLRKALHAYRNANIPVSLLYYMMAADAGIEVGSFNTAWLCEGNEDGVVTSIEKECQWRNYNLTIQREIQFIDPYALIKMGDYHWYGCKGEQDIDKAADIYAMAAMKGDPHAIFNLAFMLEDGARIKRSVWNSLGIPLEVQQNTFSLLKYLYTSCKESERTEAYIPCSISLYRVQAMYIWNQYWIIFKVCGFVVTLTVTIFSIQSIIRHLKRITIPADHEI